LSNRFSEANIIQNFQNPKLPDEKNAHISTKIFTPVDKNTWEKWVSLLNKTGFARSVIADEAKMYEYLEKHLGKKGAERFMVWYHGSINDFDKFECISAFTRSFDGIYFSNNKNTPRDYGTILYEVELPELSDEQKPFSEKERKSIDAVLNFSSNMRKNYGHINFEANVGEVIAQLEKELGSTTAAHNWLMRAGVDGYTRESDADGRVAIMFNDKAIKIKRKEKIRLMSTPKGEVYGFVTPEGDIYLDPKKLNANTPIHEFGHLWCDFVEKSNPELWAKIVDLTKQTPYYTDLLQNPAYAHLPTDNARVNEAFAQAIGDNGERVFQEKINPAFKERFKNLLQEVWSWIGGKIGIRELPPEKICNLTFEQAVNGAVNDLTRGKPVWDLQRKIKIGDVLLSSEQRESLIRGETVHLVGLTNRKSGKTYAADVRWDFKNREPKYSNIVMVANAVNAGVTTKKQHEHVKKLNGRSNKHLRR
jgi:hypothetical protein